MMFDDATLLILEFDRIPNFIMEDQGTEVEIHIYEGAGYAFANPTNSQAFRKDQALDAWAKTLDFLRMTLQAS